MADTLYLSLWYPNLRLEALGDKLTAVLGAFAAHGGEPRVYAATVWPVSWSEPPVFQQVWGRRIVVGGEGETQLGAEPAAAVEAATELLHEDYAYEFQIGWDLWEVEILPGEAGPLRGGQAFDAAHSPPTHRDKAAMNGAQPAQDDEPFIKLATGATAAQDDEGIGEREKGDKGSELARAGARSQVGELADVQVGELADVQVGELADVQVGELADVQVGKFAQSGRQLGRWVRGPRLVRVTGYGPLFDEGAYEQDGHIRIDLGPDGPFLEEDVPLDRVGARHVEENVRQLVGLAGAVEKASGATARLLWSELGESLAQKLAARLGVAN